MRPSRLFGADVPILNDIKNSFKSTQDITINTSVLLGCRYQIMVMREALDATQAQYDEKTEKLAKHEEDVLKFSLELKNLGTSTTIVKLVGEALLRAI